MAVHTDTSFVAVEKIDQCVGRRKAITDGSFQAQRGEIAGLIGPNGTGKTTLLECLARLLPIDRGAVQ